MGDSADTIHTTKCSRLRRIAEKSNFDTLPGNTGRYTCAVVELRVQRTTCVRWVEVRRNYKLNFDFETLSSTLRSPTLGPSSRAQLQILVRSEHGSLALQRLGKYPAQVQQQQGNRGFRTVILISRVRCWFFRGSNQLALCV